MLDDMPHSLTAAGTVALLALAACDLETPVACPDLADFAILEPAGAVELIPGTEGVRVAWTQVDVNLELELFDGARVRTAGFPAPFDESLQLTEPAESVLNGSGPPGVYRIRARFACGGGMRPTFETSPLQTIYAQGAEVAGGELVFDGGQAEREIVVRTVSLSTFELELLLDAAPPLDPGARVIARATVPGELVAMNRTFTFTGRDVNDLPIPAGDYDIWTRVRARDGTVTYDRAGPRLSWTP